MEFYGTKRIKAVAMSRSAYNEYRNWSLPANENGDDDGFLVEYIDGGARNDDRHEGYISWSPHDVFVKHYQSVTEGMSFGHAVEALKAGNRVARAGWNGKGMWLRYVSAGSYDVGVKTMEGADKLLPWIGMKTADGGFVPWLASQTDILADDWVEVAA